MDEVLMDERCMTSICSFSNWWRIYQLGRRGPSTLIGSELSLRTLQGSMGRGRTHHPGRPRVSRIWSILKWGLRGHPKVSNLLYLARFISCFLCSYILTASSTKIQLVILFAEQDGIISGHPISWFSRTYVHLLCNMVAQGEWYHLSGKACFYLSLNSKFKAQAFRIC